MIELLALAAAAQIQTIRLPPVAPVPVPPVERTAPAPGLTVANLFPDLVVREVRVEGDSVIHVLIANEGTAAATGVRIDTDADIGTRRGEKLGFDSIDSIGVGEAKWAAVKGLAPIGEPYYVGKDYSFPLSQATRVTVHVDPPVFGTGWMSSPEPMKAFGGGSGSKCTAEHGCIKELNEGNNRLVAEGDAIGRGKPE